MPFYLLVSPFVLLYELMLALAPIVGISIGVVAAVAAILSVIVIMVAMRFLVKAQRRWVRIAGRILVAIEIVASLAFAGVAVIAFAAAATFA